MGIYLMERPDDYIVDINSYSIPNNIHYDTLEGLVIYISRNPKEFIANNYNDFKEQGIDVIIKTLANCLWLPDKEQISEQLKQLMIVDEWKIYKDLGDEYYDKNLLSNSMVYYNKVLDIQEDDHCLCNKGLIYLSIGQVDEGIELLNNAYELKHSKVIYLILLKTQVLFNKSKSFEEVERVVHEMLQNPSKEEYLSFLVWYYKYIGDDESSMTSYMQITNMNNRFKLVDYYMTYMIKSKQFVAMESFLRPLKEHNLDQYVLKLVKVYINMDMFEKGMDLIQDHQFKSEYTNIIMILESKCNVGLKSTIQGIYCINKIDVQSLNDSDRELYYLQLATLSRFTKDFTKEHLYYKKLLSLWQLRYRKLYLEVNDS